MDDATKLITRAEKQAATRRELLEEAERVFARRGYEGASVEEIAAAAGYSHGAVYSNFEGKADLFLGVFEAYMARRAREFEEAGAGLPDDEPLPGRARALADQWIQRFDSDHESFTLHLEFLIQAQRDAGLAREYDVHSRALREMLGNHVRALAADAGVETALPVDELTLIVRALGLGLALEQLASPGAVREDLFGDFVEFLVTALLGEGRS